LTQALKHFAIRRLYFHGGIEMNLAFALNTYNQTKVASETNKRDGYEAVKYALDQVIGSMEKLNTGIETEEKEKHFERALSSIYFLQKCLDFEKGGDLAKNLFKVYEYCRVQIIEFVLKGSVEKLDSAIEFVQTILDGWDGIRPQSS
jgi:flagellar protein FliS